MQHKKNKQKKGPKEKFFFFKDKKLDADLSE